jgi:hypothetical protein
MKARIFGFAVAALIGCGSVNPLYAERVRYHFAPADLCGSTVQTPAGKNNAIGERVSYFGFGTTPYNCAKPPTHMVTFWHPFTKRNVTVPMALPAGTPRLEYGRNRITFNYGSYIVQAVFLPDGSVDTIYDSGLLTPLR